MRDEDNNKVYVNNLPLDLTHTDFLRFMEQAGTVMTNKKTGEKQIKFYFDEITGNFKGDAICTYYEVPIYLLIILFIIILKYLFILKMFFIYIRKNLLI